MTTIGRYRYEINGANAISVWDLEQPNPEGLPFMFQPDYPDGRPWENREAAEAWIVNVITTEWLAEQPSGDETA